MASGTPGREARWPAGGQRCGVVPIELISALPGVVAHAAYIGLSGEPVVHGKPDDSFLTNSVNGSLDSEYFSQDRATVLAGALPPGHSTTTVVLTPAIARLFGVPPYTRTVVITGTVTLPSFGIGGAEHVSLGRGAMVPEATLLAAMGAGGPERTVTLTLLIAVVVGGPLGVLGGRLAWRAFAGSLGIVPAVEAPLAALVLGLAALVLAGDLLAALPAAVAARTRPGVELRTE